MNSLKDKGVRKQARRKKIELNEKLKGLCGAVGLFVGRNQPSFLILNSCLLLFRQKTKITTANAQDVEILS
jgi:hypothetical protein